MIRKLLLLAITTGVASKLYRQYRQKHGEAPPGEMNARSDAGTMAM